MCAPQVEALGILEREALQGDSRPFFLAVSPLPATPEAEGLSSRSVRKDYPINFTIRSGPFGPLAMFASRKVAMSCLNMSISGRCSMLNIVKSAQKAAQYIIVY